MDPILRGQLIVEMHGIIFSCAIGYRLLHVKNKKFQGGTILGAVSFVHALALFSDIMTWLSEGGSLLWDTFAVRSFNFTLYAAHISILWLIALYFYNLVRGQNPNCDRKLLYLILGSCVIMGIGLVITPFTGFCYRIDASNHYIRGRGFYAEMGLAVIGAVLTQVMVVRNRGSIIKREIFGMLSFYLFPVIGMIIQMFMYGYSFVDIGIMISIIIMFYQYEKRLMAWRKRQDLRILQSQAYLLNSQIKPHFLFNSLNIIQSLIEEDPETAVEAVSHFSKYLRTGLKVEIMDSMVPLRQEMDYVDNYLYLEQLRHGDRLRVVRKIEKGIDFEIPYLTIQPIVENAVRHGICKRLQGGTVTIEICSEYDSNVIRIIDDGVGFYPLKREVNMELNPGSGAGVGSRNVEERIRMMCGGTMETDSEPGKGTTVTIRIPKAGKKTDGIFDSR